MFTYTSSSTLKVDHRFQNLHVLSYQRVDEIAVVLKIQDYLIKKIEAYITDMFPCLNKILIINLSTHKHTHTRARIDTHTHMIKFKKRVHMCPAHTKRLL